MHKPFLITACIFAAIAVILGAFGAHGLKQIVPPETITTFETGIRYHFYHAFALLATGMLYERGRRGWIKFAGISFIAGIVLFSGSLYLLTIFKATETVGLNKLGIITPFGGLFLIAGWIALAIALSLSPWRTA
ncbi:MAG TPA: DUF423 domain-containing protein [Flavitalea sp.]|nr:DUF423 domain-containing protein [Flavitalea sp.]